MSQSSHFVLFSLENHSIALPLEKVIRIVRSVSITPLPDAPDVIKGVVNVQGNILPVVDIRKRFGFESRGLKLEDHFIVCQLDTRRVAIIVDEVMDIISHSIDDVNDSEEILPGVPYVDGIIKSNEGVILIHDLDRLLSLQEIRQIDKSLKMAEKL